MYSCYIFFCWAESSINLQLFQPAWPLSCYRTPSCGFQTAVVKWHSLLRCLSCRTDLRMSRSSSLHGQSISSFSSSYHLHLWLFSVIYRRVAFCTPNACAGSSVSSFIRSTCDDLCSPCLPFVSHRRQPVRLSYCFRDLWCVAIAFLTTRYAFVT